MPQNRPLGFPTPPGRRSRPSAPRRLGHVRRTPPIALAALVGVLLLARGVPATGTATSDGTVAVTAVAAPALVRPGDSVAFTLRVKNLTRRRIVVDVRVSVIAGGGAILHARTWDALRVGAGSTATLADAYATPADTPQGSCAVAVQVYSDNLSTTHFDDARAAEFLCATPVYTGTRMSDPPRTVLHDAAGAWIATFTDGSRTVTLVGPARTFAESTAAYPVQSAVWVRLLPAPFAGLVDGDWLAQALADRSPDLLQLGMQYAAGAPPLVDGTGLRIAGDADYGPLQLDGTRAEGSDFNDYLGLAWAYDGTVDAPEEAQLTCLDCSGFVRMVFGYRGGLPLRLAPDGAGLPRRAYEMHESAPGVLLLPNLGTPPADLARLAPGDLVFFDISTDDGARIDHVGILLGRDTGGNYRFLSSRKGSNGPTLGDYKGKSILNGTGLYATGFRAARRP